MADYGRSVCPDYVEDVIGRTRGATQENGNILHNGGGVSVVLSPEGRGRDGADEMTNADVASDLRSLRGDPATHQLTVQDVGRAFERLTYELRELREGDDEHLRSLVNDIELMRFTCLPENQSTAVQDVFAKAQQLFDELAS